MSEKNNIKHVDNILSAWQALEVLSPNVFKKNTDLVRKNYGNRKSIYYLDTDILPWEDSTNINIEESDHRYNTFYHVVIGTIDFTKATEMLLKIYSDDNEEKKLPKGKALIASAIVDSSGYLINMGQNTIISSFAWGVNRILDNKLNELSDWQDQEKELNLKLDKNLRKYDEEDNELPITKKSIISAWKWIKSELKIPEEITEDNIYIIRDEIYYKLDYPDSLLSNSFYLEDIAITKELFRQNKTNLGLQRYMGLNKSNDKHDILAESKTLEKSISPELVPLSKWPCCGNNPLVLLQQAAVNLALDPKRDDGIISVNGPPGTGKTTLLRDVVAGLIEKRAEIMCSYTDPENAFTDTGEKINTNNSWLHFYSLDEKLKGYEILISSSNNKAVENISKELPSINTIDESFRNFSYFKSLSDQLIDGETWGLIAAVLGNSENRTRFIKNFWWDTDTSFYKYLEHCMGFSKKIPVVDRETKETISYRLPKLISDSQAPNNHEHALQNWQIAKSNFLSTLKETNKYKENLISIQNLLMEIQEIKKELISHEWKTLLINSKKLEYFLKLETILLSKRDIERKIRKYKINLSKHKEIKPFILLRIFNIGNNTKLWNDKFKKIKVNINKLENEKDITIKELQDINLSIKKIINSFNRLGKKLKNVKILISDKNDIIQAIKVNIEILDSDFYKKSHEDRHLSSPWVDKKLQNLRNKMFFESINLHKAFIDAAARPLKHNMTILMQNFRKTTFQSPKQNELIADLWSSLFLIVPCISTTFASIHRMLGSLPPESLGWLLIDEAGQATPQSALGAIMRAKKSIIVGDPLQIEPIVTLPSKLTINICKTFGIDPNIYNAPKASVQTLSDRESQFYSGFETNYGTRTVGIPLLVHRRCANPMFNISNQIAYNNLMVQAKTKKQSKIRDYLGNSCWINIQGSSIEKWCPEEGTEVLNLLNKIKLNGIKSPDIYIVTPFVVVAENLRSLIKSSKILENWITNPDEWVYERIGTIHTVQGREAEAVIFVLGAPDLTQKGARNWAGSYPNILNVAITRAKEALYVVGNKQLWKDAGLFKYLADI